MQKTFPMKFSKYFKQCLGHLEAAPDSELDTLLVHLVKVQHLTEQIYNWNSREDEDEGIPGFPGAPASAYQAAFYGDIVRSQSSLPGYLRDNGTSALAGFLSPFSPNAKSDKCSPQRQNSYGSTLPSPRCTSTSHRRSTPPSSGTSPTRLPMPNPARHHHPST